MRREFDRAGIVQTNSGGILFLFLSSLKRVGFRKDRARLFSEVRSEKVRGSGFKLH